MIRWSLLAVVVALSPRLVSAAEIELAPEGDEICCDDPDYGVKGYRFTVAQSFTAYGAEWLLEVPGGTTAAARVWSAEGSLLMEGTIAVGDGTEQWVRSDFAFDFELAPHPDKVGKFLFKNGYKMAALPG